MGKIYIKEDSVEVIFQLPTSNFTEEFIEKEAVSLYSKINKWKNLKYIEVGFSPECEIKECEWYAMPKIIIDTETLDTEKGILIRAQAHRNRTVDKWSTYHKVVLKRNSIRNITSLFKIFNTELESDRLTLIKEEIKKENQFIEI